MRNQTYQSSIIVNTAQEWKILNPTIPNHLVCIELIDEVYAFKLGDGITKYNDLALISIEGLVAKLEKLTRSDLQRIYDGINPSLYILRGCTITTEAISAMCEISTSIARLMCIKSTCESTAQEISNIRPYLVGKDTLNNWSTINPIIPEHTICIVSDTDSFHIGDGARRFNDLQPVDRKGLSIYLNLLMDKKILKTIISDFRKVDQDLFNELSTEFRGAILSSTTILQTIQDKFISQIMENIEYLEKELGMSKEETLRVLRKKLKDEPNNG